MSNNEVPPEKKKIFERIVSVVAESINMAKYVHTKPLSILLQIFIKLEMFIPLHTEQAISNSFLKVHEWSNDKMFLSPPSNVSKIFCLMLLLNFVCY